MTHQKDLRDLMLKRIKGLQREAATLRRQSGASMDSRARSRLRVLSQETKRKAEMLQARYDKLFAEHLEPRLGAVAHA